VEHEPDLLGYPDNTVWAVSAGGGGFDGASDIAIDARDNAFITGQVVGGPCFAASHGPGGGLNWVAASVDNGANHYSNAVAVAPNGDVLVTGNFEGTLKIGGLSATSRGGSDVFVVRLSSSGKPLWLFSGGGGDEDGGIGIAVDGQGNSFAVGAFNYPGPPLGGARFGDVTINANGLDDLFVLKLDPSGKLLWAVAGGGPGGDFALSAAVASDGGVIVGGSFYAKMSFGGIELIGRGDSDFYVARLSPQGRVIWITAGGGAGHDGARDVAVEPPRSDSRAQSIFFTASFSGQIKLGEQILTSRGDVDSFVARLDPKGRLLWARSSGGVGVDASSNAVTVTSTSINVVGFFEGRAHFGTTVLDSRGDDDIFVASYSPDGELRWVTQAGGPDSDGGSGIAAYSDGTLAVTGIFRDHAYFGRTKLISQGLTDIFVWRMRPPK